MTWVSYSGSEEDASVGENNVSSKLSPSTYKTIICENTRADDSKRKDGSP